MNTFAFETKAQAKGVAVWTACLVALLAVFGGAFYPAFVESRAAVQDALASLPPAFAAVFGVSMDAIFSYGGFFQFLYTYLGLVGAIMAAGVGLAAFGREKRSQCVDFLFVKPVSRGWLFVRKGLACLALLAAANAIFVAASIATYLANGQDRAGLGTLVLASLSLFFLQVVFLAVGAVVAVFARKVRSVSGMATALGFGGFALLALNSLLKEEALRYVSPLNYFNPGTVFETGGYDAKYAVAAAIVVVACVAAAWGKYSRSDTPAL